MHSNSHRQQYSAPIENLIDYQNNSVRHEAHRVGQLQSWLCNHQTSPEEVKHSCLGGHILAQFQNQFHKGQYKMVATPMASVMDSTMLMARRMGSMTALKMPSGSMMALRTGLRTMMDSRTGSKTGLRTKMDSRTGSKTDSTNVSKMVFLMGSRMASVF